MTYLSNIFGLEGKITVITGASSGMGAHFARVLSNVGASVVVTARRLDRLQQLASDLPNCVAVECDLASEAACVRMMDTVLERFGRIDVLVNNAGISQPKPVSDETPQDFDAVVQVNLVAPYTLARLAGGWMVEHQSPGCIVNVASVVGVVGLGRMPQASYAASKAGLVNLTRELAAQWARRGVRVNAIAPGFFPTEMTEELFATQRGQDWVAKLTPMGRAGRLAELDSALLYLCSPASTYTTGTIVTVDGGWTAV